MDNVARMYFEYISNKELRIYTGCTEKTEQFENQLKSNNFLKFVKTGDKYQ